MFLYLSVCVSLIFFIRCFEPHVCVFLAVGGCKVLSVIYRRVILSVHPTMNVKNRDMHEAGIVEHFNRYLLEWTK